MTWNYVKASHSFRRIQAQRIGSKARNSPIAALAVRQGPEGRTPGSPPSLLTPVSYISGRGWEAAPVCSFLKIRSQQRRAPACFEFLLAGKRQRAPFPKHQLIDNTREEAEKLAGLAATPTFPLTPNTLPLTPNLLYHSSEAQGSALELIFNAQVLFRTICTK